MSEITQSILFRQKLYENFKQSGLLDKLKTTLRVNLLEKLQKPSRLQSINGEDEQMIRKQKKQKSKPLYLRDKFLSCIVREYLFKSKKQYSLSIFVPQSYLEQQDFLNFHELGEIINLNKVQMQEKSFLQTLIEQWCKFRATQICQRSTQTDYSQPISKKLEDIEKKYLPKMDYWKLIQHPGQNKQQKSNDLTLQAKEQRMRQQFQLQKKRIKKQLQLSVKAEMQKKYEDKYDFQTREMQKAHEGRLTEIKNRQKAILQTLSRKTKDLQEKSRKINEQELKMIKNYENKIMELQIEHNRKIKQLQNKQKEFWKRELELKAKKKQYEDTIRLVKQKVVEQTLDI